MSIYFPINTLLFFNGKEQKKKEEDVDEAKEEKDVNGKKDEMVAVDKEDTENTENKKNTEKEDKKDKEQEKVVVEQEEVILETENKGKENNKTLIDVIVDRKVEDRLKQMREEYENKINGYKDQIKELKGNEENQNIH